MRRPIFPILGLWAILQSATAQQMEYLCAWEPPQGQASASGDSCLDVQYILDNCIKVYIRLNVHYFVGDDCSGTLQQTGLNQETAYQNTEAMIRALNQQLNDNKPQKRLGGVDPPCIPLRFVLSGVYVHCRSNAVAEFNTTLLNAEFGVDRKGTVNFYIGHFPNGATGVGYQKDNSGSASSFNLSTWWTLGNLYHELGHIFGLKHSFSVDDCDDTPIFGLSWDKNCNGIIESDINGRRNERNIQCWGLLSPNVGPGAPGYDDGNDNGVNDCEEVPPCTPSPCCFEENLDNNVMSYSADKSALTRCQLERMLRVISQSKCGLIEQIGGCPPTKAFIDRLPRDRVDNGRCCQCLMLEGSWEEESYEFELYEVNGALRTLVYQTGRVQGQATRFCYKTNAAYIGPYPLLRPHTAYLAVLHTFNACSDDGYEFPFVTGSEDCEVIPFVSWEIAPNPVEDELRVRIDGMFASGELSADAFHLGTQTNWPVMAPRTLGGGDHELTLNTSGLPSGAYALILTSAQGLATYKTFIKQ